MVYVSSLPLDYSAVCMNQAGLMGGGKSCSRGTKMWYPVNQRNWWGRLELLRGHWTGGFVSYLASALRLRGISSVLKPHIDTWVYISLAFITGQS